MLDRCARSVDQGFTRGCSRWGRFVARQPCLVILASFVVVAALGVGMLRLEVLDNAEKMWVSPGDPLSVQEGFFNDKFGDFWRVEQLIIVAEEVGNNILNTTLLAEMLSLQIELTAVTAELDGRTYTYNDLCYHPIPGEGCLITSPLGFWQSNLTTLMADQDIQSTVGQGDILNSIGMPMQERLVFGGVERQGLSSNLANASAAIFNFFLLNNATSEEAAMAWEANWLKVCEKAELDGLTVTYYADRSVNDELQSEATADVRIIIISYGAMFVYIAFALGRFSAVDLKFSVGLAGVVIVAMSLVASIGICALVGVEITLIISEVIPFLTLAIGVDNMFIIVHSLAETSPELTVEQRIGQAMSRVGASITLASVAEVVAFILGAATKIPALQEFCIYASMAVLCNYFLQISCFVAVLTLDTRRVAANRVDVLCCIRANPRAKAKEIGGGYIRSCMDKVWAPAVLSTAGRVVVIVVTLGGLGLSMYGASHLEMGLNPNLALPSDSYLIPFFDLQQEYLQVGPPLYVVMKDWKYEWTQPGEDGKIPMFELENQFDRTLSVEKPVYSWLDDYYAYLSIASNHTKQLVDGRPPSEPDFIAWLKEWLAIPCDAYHPESLRSHCGLAYVDDIIFDGDTIECSRMRAYHWTLRNQSDYITALINAQWASSQNAGGIESFPYSLFYVYFAQYQYIGKVAVEVVALALGAVFLVTLILLASPWTSVLIVLMVSMIEWNVLGLMYFWDVSFNGVSVVNLVMAIGLSVEFCAHISRAFLMAEGTHRERAHAALVKMGASVFSGITLTKLCGVIVLGFSPSAIFEIFYFRMYLGIVAFGCWNGLFLLPVVLSLIGPPTMANILDTETINEDDKRIVAARPYNAAGTGFKSTGATAAAVPGNRSSFASANSLGGSGVPVSKSFENTASYGSSGSPVKW